MSYIFSERFLINLKTKILTLYRIFMGYFEYNNNVYGFS